jgi:trk system potassium uptake protein TrkH
MIVLSFALVILAGTLLLMLPAASRDGHSAGALTALFTATSATCVTGLVVVDTWLSWSLLGQVVILLLIQLGGLGFVSVLTLFFLLVDRRLSLSQRLLVVSAFNLNDMDGVARLLRHAFQGTFLFEGVGAVLLSGCFIPRFGLAGGIWRGIFHAVSAFCNAGFDLMGRSGAFSSLAGYADHPGVLLTLSVLIVVGGLGFFVWEDLLTHRRWRALSLYSRMVLVATAALILLGWAVVLLCEWDNPATLGTMPVWEKVCNALFQSITLRTAGFAAIDQAGLRPLTTAVSVLLMLVGGCGGSTAGGIKVGTVCVLLLAVRAGLAGEEEVTLRGRSVPPRRVFDAMTLSFVAACLFVAGMTALCAVDGIPLTAAIYEAASAIGTVGLSMGVTPSLSVPSRLIVICLMFLGRVGILSFSMAFLTRGRSPAKVKRPAFHIMIG